MLIDANIFLEVILEQKNSEKCKTFLREIVEGKTAFLTTFTIDSIILSMIRNKMNEIKIHTFLSSLKQYKGLRIYMVSLKDRINSMSLMQKYKLDYEDSIILQSAISAKCSELVSFDRHFDKVKEIKRIEPSKENI